MRAKGVPKLKQRVTEAMLLQGEGTCDTQPPSNVIRSGSFAATIPRVAAQTARWPGIPMVACSRRTGCSKSCDLQPAFAACKWSSPSTALCRMGVMVSQFHLPSLTPLSVAGCGRLQLEAANWATSVTLLKVVYDCSHIRQQGILHWVAPGHRRLYRYLYYYI